MTAAKRLRFIFYPFFYIVINAFFFLFFAGHSSVLFSIAKLLHFLEGKPVKGKYFPSIFGKNHEK